MSVAIITRSQARALVNRLDVLVDEVELVHAEQLTWQARLEQLQNEPHSMAGLASDRHLLVEAMAAAERIANGSAYA